MAVNVHCEGYAGVSESFRNDFRVHVSLKQERGAGEAYEVRRNNLSEWSAKVRLFRDRSTRSPAFQRFFAEQIRPRIRDRLRRLGH